MKPGPLERTYNGEIRSKHDGTRVSLKGWVHRVRDHGGILFMDLRDTTGLVQVVFSQQQGKADISSDSGSGVSLTGCACARNQLFP